MIVTFAWLIAAGIMTIIFIYAWKKTNSLFKAWIIMLMFGKLIAVLYWAAGLNYTVAIIRLTNQETGRTLIINLSASLLVFLSLAITLATTLAYAYFAHILPKEIRTIYGVENE